EIRWHLSLFFRDRQPNFARPQGGCVDLGPAVLERAFEEPRRTASLGHVLRSFAQNRAAHAIRLILRVPGPPGGYERFADPARDLFIRNLSAAPQGSQDGPHRLRYDPRAVFRDFFSQRPY